MRINRAELCEAIIGGWREHPVLSRDLGRAAEGAQKVSDFLSARE